MPKIKFRNFTRGWYPMGARDQVPENTARRAEGIAPVKSTVLKSRWGSTLVSAVDAHSLHKFNNIRFAGVDATYMRLDTGAVLKTGLDGTRLTGVRIPPTSGKPDWWFVAGGTLMFKVSPEGEVSQWGIDAPPNGFTATLVARETKTIDMMEAAGGWTGASATLADEATIKQEGTNSMKMTVVASTTGTATKAITVDLSAYASGAVSPDEDFVEVWLRLDHPENVDQIQVSFDLVGGAFATDSYVRTVLVSSKVTSDGVGTVSEFVGQESEIFTATDSPLDRQTILEQIGVVTIPQSTDTWTQLRIPKSTFRRSGGNTALTWANVVAARFTVQTNALGSAIAYWDQMRLGGGVGMQGTYKYKVCYLNTKSGSRSNPNSATFTVTDVNRQKVRFTNLPISTDPQVDARELYRTVGNGTLYFRVATIADNTTTTHDDAAADFAGLDSQTTNLMESFELQTDNLVPSGSWDDTFGPYAGSVWWCRSGDPGDQGRVFYSAQGRAESQEGFIDVSGDDDPTQRGVVWNGSLYIFTSSALYQIVGTNPFTFRKVYGAPGTLWPDSVVPTPYGIVYLAHDSLRLFNGALSLPFAQEAVNLLFKGETLEDISFVE